MSGYDDFWHCRHTNFAAGFQEELNHEEVVEVTERVKDDFKGLLKAILAEL